MSVLLALQGTAPFVATDTDSFTLSELERVSVQAVSPESLALSEAFALDAKSLDSEFMLAGDAHSLNAALATSESGTISETETASQSGGGGPQFDTDTFTFSESERIFVLALPEFTESIVPQYQRRRKHPDYALAAIAAASWETYFELPDDSVD